MTVLIAKVISRISTPPAFYYANAIPLPGAYIRSIWAQFSIKKEYLCGAFLLFAILTAVAYIVEMNVIIFEGKKLPALEVALKDLEHEQKLKYATLTNVRSPLSIKEAALDGVKMVEVKNVRYLDNTDEVASNILRMP
ncbi:MAG: hypothetical protein WAP51_00735 [Candidatus Sungiibacteriota bacterium]